MASKSALPALRTCTAAHGCSAWARAPAACAQPLRASPAGAASARRFLMTTAGTGTDTGGGARWPRAASPASCLVAQAMQLRAQAQARSTFARGLSSTARALAAPSRDQDRDRAPPQAPDTDRARSAADAARDASPPATEPPSDAPAPPHLHVSDPLVDPSGRWNSSTSPLAADPRLRDSTDAAAADAALRELDALLGLSRRGRGSGSGPDSASADAASAAPLRAPSIARALAFFLALSAGAFALAAYASLRQSAALARDVQAAKAPLGDLLSWVRGGPLGERAGAQGGEGVFEGVSEGQLRAALKHSQAERAGTRVRWLLAWCDRLGAPDGLKQFVGRCYIVVAQEMLEIPFTKDGIVPILALNAGVFFSFLLFPRAYPWLFRHFVHAPWLNGPRRVSTLLTSTFAHQEPLHLLFNSIALWSIGSAAFFSPAWPLVSGLSLREHRAQAAHEHGAGPLPEASRAPHFLAFFAAAGTFAALTSHAALSLRFRAAVRRSPAWRALRANGTANAHNVAALRARLAEITSHASLGASGAVYAALVMSACAFPDARLSIIFLPFFTFPITWGIGGLVVADVVGIVRGWRMFDHYAHLGGAVFGAAYWYAGWGFYEKVKRAVYNAFIRERPSSAQQKPQAAQRRLS